LILGVAAWRFDRERFQTRHLVLGTAPYLLFALLWGWYILQSPGDFRAQFLVHAAGHNSERLRILLRPDVAIGTEIARLMTAYYLGGLWAGVMKGWMTLIPCLYVLATGWFLGSWRRHPGLTRLFAAGAAALMLGMTFLNGFKGYFYLIYLVPIYNAMLAAWLLSMWRRKAPGKYAAAAAGLVFVAVQLSISILHIRADEYHRDYQPAIQDLARYRAEGRSIAGTAALGFGMGFSGFHDDVRLGMYSGLDPDVVVIDRSYRNFDRIIEQDEPSVFAYSVTVLSTKYRLAAQHGSFWIFERARPAAGGKIEPWIDLGKLATVQKGKRAEYFFRLIFSAAQLQDPEESSL
jgi:hypothetical protein